MLLSRLSLAVSREEAIKPEHVKIDLFRLPHSRPLSLSFAKQQDIRIRDKPSQRQASSDRQVHRRPATVQRMERLGEEPAPL